MLPGHACCHVALQRHEMLGIVCSGEILRIDPASKQASMAGGDCASNSLRCTVERKRESREGSTQAQNARSERQVVKGRRGE